mgnify:CR=1 FL=1
MIMLYAVLGFLVGFFFALLICVYLVGREPRERAAPEPPPKERYEFDLLTAVTYENDFPLSIARKEDVLDVIDQLPGLMADHCRKEFRVPMTVEPGEYKVNVRVVASFDRKDTPYR